MARGIGRTRIRLARMIEAKLRDLGHSVRVDPARLDPAQGYWRTDSRADVMRWEGWFEREIEPGRWMRQSICSWDTMTDCVRGFEIWQDTGWSWEVGAHKNS
jgi:hypothetical protein